MRRDVLRLLTLACVTFPAPVLAASEEEDDVDATMRALGVEETRFEVKDKREKKMEVPPVDDPVRVDLPLLSTAHRDEGQQYLDPFLGREVYPELAAQLSLQFARQKRANSGEMNGNDGRVALLGRADFALWLLDVRVPFDTTEGELGGPVELVLKAPFAVGEHHFAPMLIAQVPADDGLDQSLIEFAFGYHYARYGFGLKLEVSGFSGTHDRRRSASLVSGELEGSRSSGMVGWNAVVSYLIGGVVGIVVEVDGTTAISERAERPKPEIGDTILALAPGLRFFPADAAFSLGLAGLFTLVPDAYVGYPRELGVLFDIGYTFM